MEIYPGRPWEIGYDERFNGTRRQQTLNGEWFGYLQLRDRTNSGKCQLICFQLHNMQ
ncbi:MAG: hypothetical protein ACR2OW_03580 [Methyloligellaceae bacterium]